MNRHIKFRVWCKTTKHFTDIPWINSWGGQLLWLHTGNNVSITNLDEGDYVVQQFTGLLDKNGKDIYEGDMLKIKVSGSILLFNLGEYIASVKWDESLSRWGLDISTPKNKFENFNPSLYKDNGREYEVIGNIFENSNLIK
jgi:uncharacterized phage protein (TIGR01671 family)